MRVPVSWLREYCDPGIGPEELADLLSMRAVEVERVRTVGAPSPEGFVVGRVLAAERHPNADRLSVCEVETGEGARTIVCGAPNVAAGQLVPVALPGAVLPGGRELGRAKLRGVLSDGMILSEVELEVGSDAAGIMILARDGETGAPAAGTPLDELLPVSEAVLELELNPNRSDCLGVYGVAREVHALTGAELAPPPWEEDLEPGAEGAVDDLASVRVEVAELCPRFTARAFSHVTVGSSPAWLKSRLLAAGQRPISNVVDVTNYVMLLSAQPLHAFDLDRVPEGEIIVRAAREGERMTTLDGVERVFDDETVLVCDRDGPSGIAGIMGGARSEVSAETSRVLLEAATWDGVNILRTSSMLGLRSEASARFEKQLHPELALRAQRLASRLLAETAGAQLVPGTIDVAADVPAPHVISLRGARLDSILGIHVERDEAAAGLGRLGFTAQAQGDADLLARVPLHRHYDVTREIDLIEEVGRLHGFDLLPRTLPAHAERVGGLTREQVLRRRAEDAMRDLGLDEIVSWSLVAPELADRLRLPAGDARRATIATGNPLTAEQSRLRTTLLTGLLDAARHNLAREAGRVALFESGRAYLAEPPPTAGGEAAGAFPGRLPAPAREPHRIGVLLAGAAAPPSWRSPERPVDFYDAKALLEGLAERLGTDVEVREGTEPFLHPGRAARIEVDGEAAGWIGELHPLVASAWDLPGGAGFEVGLAPLFAASRSGRERYADIGTQPAVHQDIAVVVGEEVAAADVVAAVRAGGGELLDSVRIFDVYRGEQTGADRKSLAMGLEFRAPERTLTDAEVSERRGAIVAALAGIGGELRG